MFARFEAITVRGKLLVIIGCLLTSSCGSKDPEDGSASPILAEIPERHITLSSHDPEGALLRIDSDEQVMDWLLSTPEGTKPVMQVSDFDGDGHEELGVVAHIGSGTGIAIDELHVVSLDGEFQDVRFKPEDYIAQLKAASSFRQKTTEGKLTGEVAIHGEALTEIAFNQQQATECGKLRNELYFGNIVRFRFEGDKLKAEFGVGVLGENLVLPDYIGVLESDITYRSGTFELTRLTFTSKA